MSTRTTNLDLFKWDTSNPTDLNSNFNINTSLNDNWDKIDAKAGTVDTAINNLQSNKVDKVTGKGLSTNDFTNEYKDQVDDNTDDITDIKAEQTTQNNNIINLQTNKANVVDVYSKTDTDALISGFITKDVNNLANYTKTGDMTTAINNAVGLETIARQNSDINLQNQIDAITSASDVVDIVGTYTELQNYDTSGLTSEDVIKVLQDITHNNALSYYRWVINQNVGVWSYIGSEGPFYTKSETDGLLNEKQDEINSNNKLNADLIDDGNTTNKFVNTSEKQAWNNKYDKPSGGIPKTDLVSDIQRSLSKADTAIQAHQDITGKEDKANKVTTISASSTNEEYPSSLAVYNYIQSLNGNEVAY